MKSFTEKERAAAFNWIESKTADALGEMSNEGVVNALFEVINNAEGMPVGNGDKYIAAKDEIQFSLNALNSSITDAVRLGMVVLIADTSKQIPPVQVTKFVLERIYKDF